jgi:hypothetical protein
MPLMYQSGKEIKTGDRVLYDGEPGEIEFVAHKLVRDPATDWYVKEHGGGVMVLVPKVFGSVFVHDPQSEEDLVIVSRG